MALARALAMVLTKTLSSPRARTLVRALARADPRTAALISCWLTRLGDAAITAVTTCEQTCQRSLQSRTCLLGDGVAHGGADPNLLAVVVLELKALLGAGLHYAPDRLEVGAAATHVWRSQQLLHVHPPLVINLDLGLCCPMPEDPGELFGEQMTEVSSSAFPSTTFPSSRTFLDSFCLSHNCQSAGHCAGYRGCPNSNFRAFTLLCSWQVFGSDKKRVQYRCTKRRVLLPPNLKPNAY